LIYVKKQPKIGQEIFDLAPGYNSPPPPMTFRVLLHPMTSRVKGFESLKSLKASCRIKYEYCLNMKMAAILQATCEIETLIFYKSNKKIML
jgi:hypothetical protein